MDGAYRTHVGYYKIL